MRKTAERNIAVGFFDGVHCGHRAILNGADAVLTFSRHPLELIHPESAPKLIMSLAERVAAIRACGVADVKVLDFTDEIQSMPCEEFAAREFGRPGETKIRCGGDWRFGRGGVGNADWLRAHGYGVETVDFCRYSGEKISSSRIRRALVEGYIENANSMLGRPYSLSGCVVKGKGLGSQIGFPTVNIKLSEDKVPLLRRGVYAVVVGGAKGIANYGVAPTMGDAQWLTPILEIHFTDEFSLANPGDKLNIEFTRFIREERKFSSLEELRRQIHIDLSEIG
jgi:riboflavin kinase/FMN adenylyltransferase